MSKRFLAICAPLLALVAVTIVVAPALAAEPRWYRRPAKGVAAIIPFGVPTPAQTEGKLALRIGKFAVACSLKENEIVENPPPLGLEEGPAGVTQITSFALSECVSKECAAPEATLTVTTEGPPPAWSSRLISRGGKLRDEIALGHILATCAASRPKLVHYDITGTLAPAFSANLAAITPAPGELEATRTLEGGEAKRVADVTARGKYRLEAERSPQEHKEKKKPVPIYPHLP
jgi:hypothetical protein